MGRDSFAEQGPGGERTRDAIGRCNLSKVTYPEWIPGQRALWRFPGFPTHYKLVRVESVNARGEALIDFHGWLARERVRKNGTVVGDRHGNLVLRATSENLVDYNRTQDEWTRREMLRRRMDDFKLRMREVPLERLVAVIMTADRATMQDFAAQMLRVDCEGKQLARVEELFNTMVEGLERA